jgi:hypothetical protein
LIRVEQMTNVYGSPEKVEIKAQLFDAAVSALENAGWKVERIPGSGKSSVRRITKGKESKVVSVRTTQDRSIAFPRTAGDKGWRTLDDVDLVIAVSVDDAYNPRFANVHMLDGDDMRDRFNRAYAARKRAGYTIPIGRGVWLSLYNQEGNEPVTRVGAGAGLETPPMAVVPLTGELNPSSEANGEPTVLKAGLSIEDAKRGLAITFGVKPENIKITVEA